MPRTPCFVIALLLVCLNSAAQTVIYETNVTVQTFAGSGFYGHVDGTGTETMFYSPYAITPDSEGNVYVSDVNNSAIRKISSEAIVTTVLSNYQIGGICIFSNTFWGWGNYFYQVALPEWSVQTISTPLSPNYSYGMAIDSTGVVYVSDTQGHRIYRRLSSGDWEVYAGSGNPGYANGRGIFTSFMNPRALAIDVAGNLFVADRGNYVIRKINPDREVTTHAGIARAQGHVDNPSRLEARFTSLNGLAVDGAGNVIVSENYAVRKVSPQGVTTLAGGVAGGFKDGNGSNALFVGNQNLCVAPDDNIYVADSGGHRIRRVRTGPARTPSPSSLALSHYAGVTINGIPGRSYRIERSEDPITNWTTAATITLPTTPHVWFDMQSTNRFRRFYRSVLVE